MGGDTWQQERADRVLQAAGTKPLWEYINRRQATVAQWGGLRPISEVCAKETGYERGGRLCEKWWRWTAAERQLKTTLKDIFAGAWKRRRRESVSRGEGDGGENDSGSGGDG